MRFTPCGRDEVYGLRNARATPRAARPQRLVKGREPSERMLRAVYTRFNTLPPPLYILLLLPN